MDANPTDTTPGHTTQLRLTPEERTSRLLDYLAGPTRKIKGHRNPHRVHNRGMRDLNKRYKKKSLCNRRGVEPAFRRRQQDYLDAQRRIEAQIELGILPKMREREFAGAVQTLAAKITEARGGW